MTGDKDKNHIDRGLLIMTSYPFFLILFFDLTYTTHNMLAMDD